MSVEDEYPKLTAFNDALDCIFDINLSDYSKSVQRDKWCHVLANAIGASPYIRDHWWAASPGVDLNITDEQSALCKQFSGPYGKVLFAAYKARRGLK